MKYTDHCIENFPAPTFRRGQEDYLTTIAEALESDKKYIFFQGATGIGKSNIGFALARCVDKSVIHTSMNTLVTQYMEDELFSQYGDEVFSNIKGKGKYLCKKHGDCDKGIDSECKESVPEPGEDNSSVSCSYKKQKQRAMGAQMFVTNSSYYTLAVKEKAGFLNHYPLVIGDEAHKLPGVILNLVSLSITKAGLKVFDRSINLKELILSEKIKIQGGLESISKKGDMLPTGTHPLDFDSTVEFIDELISSMMDKEISGDYKGIPDKAYKDMVDFRGRVDRFKSSLLENVRWISDLVIDNKKGLTISLRPIHTYYFAKNFFSNVDRADKYIYMSATIMDAVRFAHDMGIDEDAYIYIKSPIIFPAENRPAYFLDSGNFSYRNMKRDPDLKKKIIGAIKYILESYPNKRGIIHCGSYSMARYIEKNLKDDRLIYPVSEEEKIEAFKRHEKVSDSVIVSPAVTEGIDMKGDLARFQIMATIPYPSLSDRRVKERLDEDPEWYALQASYNIIQAYGRGVRSETDTCDFYFIDSRFSWFIRSREHVKEFFGDSLKSRNSGIAHLQQLRRNN